MQNEPSPSIREGVAKSRCVRPLAKTRTADGHYLHVLCATEHHCEDCDTPMHYSALSYHPQSTRWRALVDAALRYKQSFSLGDKKAKEAARKLEQVM